jgi:hypothetical protein
VVVVERCRMMVGDERRCAGGGNELNLFCRRHASQPGGVPGNEAVSGGTRSDEMPRLLF